MLTERTLKKQGCIEPQADVINCKSVFHFDILQQTLKFPAPEAKKPCKFQCKVVIFDSIPMCTIVKTHARLKAVIPCFSSIEASKLLLQIPAAQPNFRMVGHLDSVDRISGSFIKLQDKDDGGSHLVN